jgi:chemotaxis signal transduction protein
VNGVGTDLAARLAALRREFDDGFAAAPAAAVEASEDFLLAVVGGARSAFRLRDLRRLAPLPGLVRLPGGRAELLGAVGLGGAVIPVFDLARALGAAQSTEPRWLVACGADAEIAFAFDAWEGRLRAPRSRVRRTEGGAASRRFAEEIVSDGATVRAVVDLPSLAKSLMGARVRA